jgi:hypothetical protein
MNQGKSIVGASIRALCNLVLLFQGIRAMPYYKNYAATTGFVHAPACHEEAIEKKLKKHGFKEVRLPVGVSKKEAETWIEHQDLAKIPRGSYILQPFGTHQSPDFIIRGECGKVVFLEAKSSKGTHPLYNSGGVKPHYIYVFCSEKINETTIYLGKSIITIEQNKIISAHIQKLRTLDAEINATLKKLDINHRGICFYTRPMINQAGGKSFTNYFDHENRQTAEDEIFKWLGQ